MGLHDRPYWREPQGGGGGLGGVRLVLPRPSRVVTGIMIACAVVFLVQIFSDAIRKVFLDGFSLVGLSPHELWRYLTFQFVHANAGHFVWNMLALYFFGTTLERTWGPRKFLVFYLVCGVVAGICYLLVTLVWPEFRSVPIVGASGGIMGCLMACAILFPGIIVLIFPIRWVVGFLIVLYVLSLLHDRDLSDAAHLGGAAAAAVWVWLLPKIQTSMIDAKSQRKQGAWRRKMQRLADEQATIDRILDKIKQEGINSLSAKEKRTLQNATHRQRDEEPDARL